MSSARDSAVADNYPAVSLSDDLEFFEDISSTPVGDALSSLNGLTLESDPAPIPHSSRSHEPTTRSASQPPIVKTSPMPLPLSPVSATGSIDDFVLPWEEHGLPSPLVISRKENLTYYTAEERDKKVKRMAGGGMVVKYGKEVREAEAKMMAWARERGLPVPEVRGFYRFLDEGYLFMEHVDGVSYDQAWPHLSQSQRSSLLASISSAASRIRSFSDSRICTTSGEPPASLGVFQTCLSALESPKEMLDRLLREFTHRLKGKVKYVSPAFHFLDQHPLFLSQSSFRLQHCDLAPRNILVDPVTGELKAIIDWEEAAFLPVGFDFAALRFEEEQSGRLPGWAALRRTLLALATEEDKYFGEYIYHAIGDFTRAEYWINGEASEQRI
ncbi:hypothetical protein JCM10213v2_003693 [Rhodosporidiobolus nylandii]